MIVDTLLKCPARHKKNSLNHASTKFHQDSKPWRCGSLLQGSWASSVSTKLPFCLSQSLDIIPGPVAPYIWHHLAYLLDPLAQSCGKMLKESRGYINWHQLRISTSNSHPKALKAPLKYHSKVETSERLGFLASTPPTHTTLANRTSISTPRSVAIEEANDGAGRQRAQSSCPDCLWHLLAWKWALVASTSSWMNDLMLVLPLQTESDKCLILEQKPVLTVQNFFFAPPQRSTQIWCPMGCYP